MSYREPPGYVDPLLALRGVCALGVLCIHLPVAGAGSVQALFSDGWPLGETARAFFEASWPSTGKNFVLFFFVHSGYLMGKVYFMGRYPLDGAGYKRYMNGRLRRIAPLLYVNLIACLLFLPSAKPTLVEAFGDFFFVNNFTGRGINGPTWSLSWEMQYYLLAPLVFRLFGKVTWRNLVTVLVIGVFFEVLAVTKTWDKVTEFFLYFLIGFAVNPMLRLTGQHTFRGAATLAWVGGFCGGNAAFYWLARELGDEKAAQPVIAVTAAIAVYLLELPRKDASAPPKYESYGPLRLGVCRFWTWMGIISYGVYLWHWPVIELMTDSIRSSVQAATSFLDVAPGSWRGVAVTQAVQLGIILPAVCVLSLLTFLFVELRFRPNLYSFDDSRILGPALRRIGIQLGGKRARSAAESSRGTGDANVQDEAQRASRSGGARAHRVSEDEAVGGS